MPDLMKRLAVSVKRLFTGDYRDTAVDIEGIKEYRCAQCRALLFKGKLERGAVIEIKCRGGNCGHAMNRFEAI